MFTGWSPLHQAGKYLNLDAEKKLKALGADVSAEASSYKFGAKARHSDVVSQAQREKLEHGNQETVFLNTCIVQFGLGNFSFFFAIEILERMFKIIKTYFGKCF